MEFPFAVIVVAVSSCAVLVNIVVLICIVQATMMLIGYKYFLTSLAVSNILISMVNIPYFVLDTLSDMACPIRVIRSLQISGFLVNLFNLCGMSFDHLLGVVRT